MKYRVLLLSLVVSVPAWSAESTRAQKSAANAYINQNIGFNVKGYKYKQSELPCNVDQVLVEEITKRGAKENINIEPVATVDKIRNGVIPVIAIDIEKMVLGNESDRQFGTKSDLGLPKMQVTVAVVKGDDMVTAKHTCAIASVNELMSSSDSLDMGTPGVTYCKAMRKCIRELSKDIVDWAAPQL